MEKVEENAHHVRDNLNDRPDATSVHATKEATMTKLLIAPEKLQGALTLRALTTTPSRTI
jgi:hypothetical protein